MTPKTYRRKLQKKLKHRPYRKCPQCGYPCVWADGIRNTIGGWNHKILDATGHSTFTPVIKVKAFILYQCKCGYMWEVGWSSGGTADTLATSKDGGL